MNFRYPLRLLIAFIIFWLFMAIKPSYRSVWVTENILPFIFVVILVATYSRFQFSNTNYTLMFVFLLLHTIGSHYTYTETPFFSMLGFARNHYDRVVHFLFGVLFYFPIHQLISTKLRLKGFWSYFMTLLVILSLKAAYEIVEFGSLFVIKDSLAGTNFLGMQGDQWDAQKDMFLGLIGGLLGWGIMKTNKKM